MASPGTAPRPHLRWKPLKNVERIPRATLTGESEGHTFDGAGAVVTEPGGGLEQPCRLIRVALSQPSAAGRDQKLDRRRYLAGYASTVIAGDSDRESVFKESHHLADSRLTTTTAKQRIDETSACRERSWLRARFFPQPAYPALRNTDWGP